MAYSDTLSAQTQQARRFYLAHARRPFVRGPWSEAYALWRRTYEARAAAADQNPAFAATLLPRKGTATVGFPGLPVRPAGVRFAVDQDKLNSVTLTVDLGNTLTFTATSPSGLALTPVITSSATRTTAVFDALNDGLYRVRVLSGTIPVTVLLIPVHRAAFRRFRESNRAAGGGFAFSASARPKPDENYHARLALLIGMEAAAATGQADLYTSLAQDELALPAAPSPVALYHG